MDDAGDVGGQVHDVGQVQHERRLGHVHRRAVRVERVGDRADGVLVLLEVLRRPGQGGGQRQVALVVAGAPDGAGQHPRGDQAALAADQHLGGGAEQAVDVEGPAHRVVSASRRSGQRTSIGSSAVATRSRASTTFSRSPALIRATASATTRHPLRRRSGRRRRSATSRGRPRRLGRRRAAGRPVEAGRAMTVVSQVRSPRRPTTTSGHDQHGVARARRRRRRAEADQAGAGLVDLVADHGARGGLAPPLVGVGEPGRRRWCGSRRPRPSRPGPRRGAARSTGRSVGQQVEQGGPPRSRSSATGADDEGSRHGSSGVALVVTSTKPTRAPAARRPAASGPVDDDLVADLHLVEQPRDRRRSRAR